MDINYKAIGVRIKAARARKGVTQGYIANLIGLSTPHISNIETGNTKLGLPTIIHLANVLDVSVDELLCDNIKRSEKIFQNELADLLKDCSAQELHFITELIKVVKKNGYAGEPKRRGRKPKKLDPKNWPKQKKLPNNLKYCLPIKQYLYYNIAVKPS